MGTQSRFEKKISMILIAVFCCVVWGSAFPSIKLSYQMLKIQNEFQMIFFAGLRFTLAGAGVLLFARIKMKQNITPKKKDMPFILLIAFLQTLGGYLLFYIGIGNTTAIKSSILIATSVFSVAILAHFMFREDRLSWKKGLGLLIGFAGVVFVNFTLIDETLFSFSLTGEGAILASATMGAVAVVLIRKRRGKINVVTMNGWQLFLGGIGLIVVGFAGHPHLLAFTPASAALLIWLAAVSGVAFTLWFTLLRYHNASVIEQYKFLVPVSGSLLSVLMLPGEHLGLEMLFAVLLVAAGTFIVNHQYRAKRQRRAKQIDTTAKEQHETDY